MARDIVDTFLKSSGRDAADIATSSLDVPRYQMIIDDPLFLPEVEDRRLFTFHNDSARDVMGNFHGLSSRSLPYVNLSDAERLGLSSRSSPYAHASNRLFSSSNFNNSHQLVFQRPSMMAICIRRAVRRQVMFSRGKAGRYYRPKRPRNYFSDIGC